jgi:hypothetical protein
MMAAESLCKSEHTEHMSPAGTFTQGNGSAAGQLQGIPPIWDTPGAIACGTSLTHAYGHKAWRIYIFIYFTQGAHGLAQAQQGTRGPLMPARSPSYV